jgi:GDP-L-fucose synthase
MTLTVGTEAMLAQPSALGNDGSRLVHSVFVTTVIPKDARIFVAGHAGLVGSAILRRLDREGFTRIETATRDQLDLRDQAAVNYWFRDHRPEYVFLVAGTVGGILANSTRPAEFIYDNMMIHATVVHASYLHGARKLLYLGSSCIYPRESEQPIVEEALLTGPLEPTNEAYAIAKIAGIKLCQAYRTQYGCDFISAMPTNLYGPNDNFDLASSHVLPAMIRKFHDAKVSGATDVEIWGTGTPKRELLHVDDLADACLFLMQAYDGVEHVNVGTGSDLSIREIAELVASVVHPTARLVFDASKPDGMPRKVLDVSKLAELGWTSTIGLREGIETTYEWFLAQATDAIRGRERAGVT